MGKSVEALKEAHTKVIFALRIFITVEANSWITLFCISPFSIYKMTRVEVILQYDSTPKKAFGYTGGTVK